MNDCMTHEGRFNFRGFFMFQFVTVIKEYATTQTGHSIDLVTESMSRRTWIPISAATLSMLLLK